MTDNSEQINQVSTSEIISLFYNPNGIFVFNPDDWLTLRKQHRIIGEMTGNSNLLSKLPLKLHPEEVVLLIELKVVRVLRRKEGIRGSISPADENFTKTLLEEEKKVYRKIRKRQLQNFKDNILAAKRKKGDDRPLEEILEDELHKSCQVTEENMIWPILNEPVNLDIDSHEEVSAEEIRKQTTNLKCMVYRDLWQRGYYITSGHKFGGDYLVYKGDPIAYHAMFIIRCVEDNRSAISPSEIVAFGRLGTSVKKRAVLASLNENNEISYVTINWIDA